MQKLRIFSLIVIGFFALCTYSSSMTIDNANIEVEEYQQDCLVDILNKTDIDIKCCLKQQKNIKTGFLSSTIKERSDEFSVGAYCMSDKIFLSSELGNLGLIIIVGEKRYDFGQVKLQKNKVLTFVVGKDLDIVGEELVLGSPVRILDDFFVGCFVREKLEWVSSTRF